jgi:hypothetical protein
MYDDAANEVIPFTCMWDKEIVFAEELVHINVVIWWHGIEEG